MAGDSNTTATRLGQIDLSGDALAIFLKKFSGEVLQTFEESNIMMPLHMVKTIQNGKSAQFPVTGVATADYHVPGENIASADVDGSGKTYLSQIRNAEKIISIDPVLIASTFVANIDEIMNHWDARSVYASELGRTLAIRSDTAIIKTFIAAARSSANYTGGNVGDQIDVSAASTTADADSTGNYTAANLQDSLFLAAEKLDDNDIPNDGRRFAVLSPTDYYKLVNASIATSALNRDVGGLGSIASGTIPQVAGINIFKSTHIPTTDLSGTSTGDGASNNDVFGGSGVGYNGDFSDTVGIVAHPSAVGTVKLLDLATESEYKMELQGTLLLAKYAMGHGVLRPEAAFELVK